MADPIFNNIPRYVYNLRRYDHILYGVTFDNLLNIRVLLFSHRSVYRLIYLTGYILFSHPVVGILWFLGITTYFSNGNFIYMLYDFRTFFHYISNAIPTLIASRHFYFKIFVNFVFVFFFSFFFIYICKFVFLFFLFQLCVFLFPLLLLSTYARTLHA